MTDRFFDKPILSSPYDYPSRYWELDAGGQPTGLIKDRRRLAEYITPIPKPKKRRSDQIDIVFDEGRGLSTEQQQYDPTPIINALRRHVDKWRDLPDPNSWRVTPETARLLQHRRHHRFTDIRPFFCQVEAVDLSKGGRALLQGRGPEISTIESEGQMLQRVMPDLMGLKSVIAFNDEAHHCYREKPGDEDEDGLKGDDRREAELCRVVESYPKVLSYVKNQNLGLEVPYRMGSEARKYIPDFIVLVDDGKGKDDPLHLVVEVKGYRREDAKEKKATMDTCRVPGINNLRTYGRWAFAEFADVYEMEVDFAAKVKSELDRVIDAATSA